MTNVFTQTTDESLLQRISRSFKAFITGGAIFCISFVVLWKNEGCAVSQQAALDELKTKAIKADAQNPTAAFNGKPVLLQAALYSKNFAYDDQFIVKQPYLKIERIVEMYQWLERREKSSKRSGSRTEKVTYSKEWIEDYQPSAEFREPAGHSNPTPAFKSEIIIAKDVSFGKFKGENILKEVSAQEPIQISNNHLSTQVESLKIKLKKNTLQVIDNTIYLTTVGYQRPEIGDLRIRYLGVKSEYYSAIGTQTDSNNLIAYTAQDGLPIMIVEKGTKNISAMIKAQQKRNTQLTWVIRGLGVFLMWLGLMALLRPFMVLLETMPLIGDVVNFGVFAVAAAISICLSSIVIIVAKLFYNPVYLLPFAALIAGYFYWQSKKIKPSSSVPAYRSDHPVLARVAPLPPQAPRRTVPVPASFKKSA